MEVIKLVCHNLICLVSIWPLEVINFIKKFLSFPGFSPFNVNKYILCPMLLKTVQRVEKRKNVNWVWDSCWCGCWMLLMGREDYIPFFSLKTWRSHSSDFMQVFWGAQENEQLSVLTLQFVPVELQSDFRNEATELNLIEHLSDFLFQKGFFQHQSLWSKTTSTPNSFQVPENSLLWNRSTDSCTTRYIWLLASSIFT